MRADGRLILKCKLKIVLESAMTLYVHSQNGTLTCGHVVDALRKRINADVIDAQGCFMEESEAERVR